MNQQQEQQQSFEKVALFSVVALSVISFLFYEFTSKPDLYGSDSCHSLRYCVMFMCWEYFAFVLIIAVLIQWKASEGSRVKLYIVGLMILGFIISNIVLAFQYYKYEPCNLLHVMIFWYLILTSIVFVLFSGTLGALVYLM